MGPSDNAFLVPGALTWGEMRNPDFGSLALQGPPGPNRAVNFTQGKVTGQGASSVQHLFLPDFFFL